MQTLSKKHLGYILGAMLAVLLAVPVLMGFVDTAQAAPLTGDELFGGSGKKAADFAGAAGLGSADLITGITTIIRVALGFLGIIAVIIILLGGFKWMTSQGDKTKLDDAKKLIYSGIIGLVIILSAFAIASFVINQITSVTGQPKIAG